MWRNERIPKLWKNVIKERDRLKSTKLKKSDKFNQVLEIFVTFRTKKQDVYYFMKITYISHLNTLSVFISYFNIEPNSINLLY